MSDMIKRLDEWQRKQSGWVGPFRITIGENYHRDNFQCDEWSSATALLDDVTDAIDLGGAAAHRFRRALRALL